MLVVGKGNPEWNFSAPHGAGKESIMAIPTIDMVRTGQNINRLRKLAAVLGVRIDDILVMTDMQILFLRKLSNAGSIPVGVITGMYTVIGKNVFDKK